MKRHYFLILLISIFAVSSCSYNQLALNPNNGNYVVSYDDSIPDSLKRTIAITFDNARVEDKNKTRIYLKNFNSSIYNIYAGSSLRSLEGEITAVIQLEIVNELKTKNKSIKIMKRHNSGELNPFAEKETIRTLQKIIDNEIYNQILLEVGLFEM
jgi:hypothetical protein